MSDLIMAGLLPVLREKGQMHRDRASLLGIEFVFTAGLRTWAEQIAAFRKGRTASPDGWHVTDPRKVVTMALPEHAPHVRGAAYDIVPIVNEKAAWDRIDLFMVLGRIGKDLGLVWGGDWVKLKDMPHFELPDWRGLPMPQEQDIA